jgi:rare lipoprotein A
LVSLSPGAFAQLEAAPGTAVRVRRVNPMEEERAKLRAGNGATLRMDTPQSLVTVLRRKLPAGGLPPALAAAAPSVVPAAASVPARPIQSIDPDGNMAPPAPSPAPPSLALPPLNASPRPASPLPVRTAQQAPSALPRPAAAAPATPRTAEGAFIVQAGAYSTQGRAERVAKTINGNVIQSGGIYRVRTGPFADRGQAEASLAKVRAAGYTEARIFTNG